MMLRLAAPMCAAKWTIWLRSMALLGAVCAFAGACSQVDPGAPNTAWLNSDAVPGGNDLVLDASNVTPTDDGGTGFDAEADVIEDVIPYEGPACTTDSACKDETGTPFCAKANQQCVECLLPSHCPGTNYCKNYKCIEFTCSPGATTCEGDFLTTCNADGKSVAQDSCPDDKPVCSLGKCLLCKPGQQFCAAPATGQPASKALMQCAADGMQANVAEACQGTAVCQNKKCQTCVPGTKQCAGDKAMACNSEGGSWDEAQDCAATGLTCVGGLCVNPCSGDIKSNTYVGCDFYAVDLDNAKEGTFDAQNQQFAVVVSNTTGAVVTVTAWLGTPNTVGAKKKLYTVAAKALQVVKLPDPSWGVPNQNQEGSNINNRAYRLTATAPIVAYQFNPLENTGVFSNDASLLLPATSLGNAYRVVTRNQNQNYRNYFTVVAAQNGETSVTVTMTGKTLAGVGVTAMSTGQTKVFTLQQGQVLNVESDSPGAGGDLTGTLITSSKAVAVFVGSEASNSPDHGNCVPSSKGGKICAGTYFSGAKSCSSDKDCDQSCCADHLEEQLFPISALGTTYVGNRLAPRGKEKDAWRILAVEDGTTFTVQPPIVAIPALAKGKFFEFETAQDFLLTANKPVLVAQFMASSFATVTKEPTACSSSAQCTVNTAGFLGKCLQGNCSPIGDPSLIMGVATSQYLQDYVFLVPDKYLVNYINIVLPAGATANIDTLDIAPILFSPIAGTTWTVARMPIAAGPHHLTTSQKSGLTVYGYDKDVSYGYPGGAGLSGTP